MLDVARPAHLWVPERRGSYVDEVRDVARMVGRPLDPSQEIAVDALTSYGPGGQWLTLETGLKVPRQNGKTAGIQTPIVLTDLFVWDADRIAWTAHLFRTAREAFDDHVRLIQSTPEFDRRVAKISYANGEEAIELTSGARLEYLARSKGGGRGLGGKRVVIDEALFFPAESAGALLPILAARENPQINYLSSAARTESDHLRALTARGRAGGDPSLIWVEFCAPGSFAEPGCVDPQCDHNPSTAGCVLDDVDYLRAANPAIASGRISLEFLRAMRRTLPPVEFAREFLGWDEVPPDAALARRITPEEWKACADPESRIAAGKVWAIDVSVDGRHASIAVAGKRADGLPHGELVDHSPGTDWVVPRLLELLARHETLRVQRGEVWHPGVVLDPIGQAGGLLQPLRAAGVDPVVMGAREAGQACAWLLGAVLAGSWRHLGQSQVDDALAVAVPRSVGDGGWAWGRAKSGGARLVDISPLVAVTNAAWGLSVAEARLSLVPLVEWGE